MPLSPIEQVEFGGVDSRSNPINMPPNRLLRCLNWVPKQAGYMELRWGYSTVSMSTVTATAITGLFPFRLWDGTKYVLIFQGATWKTFAVSTGTATSPTIRGAAIASSSKGNAFVFNNRLHYGNGTDQKFFDGSTWRDSGIRAPSSAEANSVSVAAGATDTTNGLPIATLGGYQIYMSYYNPTTGHVGNRIAIGARLNNTASTVDISISSLPDLSLVGGNNSAGDSEWQIVFGRTGDGAQVPYVLTDSVGNWLTAGNTATSVSLAGATIDGNFELPTRNGIIPSAQTMFAVVGDYVYSADPNSPTIRLSGSALDANQGKFMGRPEQSWAGNDIETFPTAEAVTGLFEVDLEAFCGTLTDCAVLTDLAGIRAWRGPWPVGIAGPRAGTKTHHGFFWLSGDKELCTFINGLPTPVSEEYEAAELAQIGDAFLSTVELRYVRRADLQKDEIRIEAQKSDGTPYTIIHDFRLMDSRSPMGQGYSSQFLGELATAFTSAIVRDANSKLQAFAGGANGQLYQLYSGANDAGNEFTADAISLINPGPNRPSVQFVDWYGDANLQVSIGKQLACTLGVPTDDQINFEDLTTSDDPGTVVQGYEKSFRFRAYIQDSEMIHTFFRFQLTSHSVDGDLTLSSPPHLPVEDYGRAYAFIPTMGDSRGV